MNDLCVFLALQKRITKSHEIQKMVLATNLLRLKIFTLSTIVPVASLLFLIVSLLFQDYIGTVITPRLTLYGLQAIATVECLFYVFFQWNIRRLSSVNPLPKPKLTARERRRLFLCCMETVHDIRSYLSLWFHHADFDHILRGDLERFMSWAFFVHKPENLTVRQLREIDEMILFIEQRFRVKFANGDSNLRCMRLNFDPLAAHHRPFFFYLLIFICQKASLLYFSILGFRKYRSRHHPLSQTLLGRYPLTSSNHSTSINYYIRETSTASTDPPIVFIHGIGVGIFVYVSLFKKLIESNRTVIIIELPHVSTLLPVVYQSFIEQINSPRQVAEAIRDILNAHDIESATFVGHSLGSTVLSWAVKFIPDMVQKAVFIDPVCFLLHHADVAYNFVYRVPRSVDQLIIHYFASREMNTAWFLGRGFVWYDNVLFEADIPKHVDVSIFLSEKDCIVPVQMVSEEYGGRRDVRILKGVNHAEFIVHPELVNAVVQTILSNADNEQCEDESGYFSQ